MSSENSRDQLINGYRYVETGLNNERIKNWTSLETENEKRGALAAMVFYGACVRECMSQGIDEPVQAHWVALALLSALEENDFEKVLYYMIGHPLPTEVQAGINHYKESMQSEVSEAVRMIDNLKIEIDLGGVKVIVGSDGITDDSFDDDLIDEDDENDFGNDDNN